MLEVLRWSKTAPNKNAENVNKFAVTFLIDVKQSGTGTSVLLQRKLYVSSRMLDSRFSILETR